MHSVTHQGPGVQDSSSVDRVDLQSGRPVRQWGGEDEARYHREEDDEDTDDHSQRYLRLGPRPSAGLWPWNGDRVVDGIAEDKVEGHSRYEHGHQMCRQVADARKKMKIQQQDTLASCTSSCHLELLPVNSLMQEKLSVHRPERGVVEEPAQKEETSSIVQPVANVWNRRKEVELTC